MLFNSPITSSPVIYGKSLFFAGNDGYLYVIDSKKFDIPTSVFTYYTIIIAIIVFIAIATLITIIKRRT